MGSLNVKLVYNNNENLIFSKSTNQGTTYRLEKSNFYFLEYLFNFLIGNRWLQGFAYIPKNIQYKLIFESVRGGTTSDIAIDDISIDPISSCQCK